MESWDQGGPFRRGEYSSEWSYNGDTMQLTVASPRLSYDLRLTGAEQVMYAEDKLGIKDSFRGSAGDRSYYYSLPRVEIVGQISYTGKGGIRHEIDVTGQGGSTASGRLLDQVVEWSSLRFSNGARVNLYNFSNGYQVPPIRKPTAPRNGWTRLLSARTGTSERLSEAYGCRGLEV